MYIVLLVLVGWFQGDPASSPGTPLPASVTALGPAVTGLPTTNSIPVAAPGVGPQLVGTSPPVFVNPYGTSTWLANAPFPPPEASHGPQGVYPPGYDLTPQNFYGMQFRQFEPDVHTHSCGTFWNCVLCISTGDMPQHFAYSNPYAANYSFRPYNWTQIQVQQRLFGQMGGYPMMAYDNRFFEHIYQETEARQGIPVPTTP